MKLNTNPIRKHLATPRLSIIYHIQTYCNKAKDKSKNEQSYERIERHTSLAYILTVPVNRPNIVINAPHAPYIVPYYRQRQEKSIHEFGAPYIAILQEQTNNCIAIHSPASTSSMPNSSLKNNVNIKLNEK